MEEEKRRVEVPIQVTGQLVEVVTEQVIRERIQHLVGLFKQDYERLFPTQIDEATFLYLAHLSFALASLEGCDGFDAHLAEFKNDVDSTYLVTTLASHLRPRVRELRLEPETPSMSKRADVKIILQDGRELFFECKNPKKEILSQLRDEQEPMYEALKECISRPCDVSITYEESLTETELARLGRFLKERLPLVTGEGTILDRDGLMVEVTNVRDSFQDIGEIQAQMILDNYHANERNPVNIINRNGVAIMFVKRGVSVIKNVEQQFKASRNKVPRDAPLILVIQSDYLTGPLDENIRAISSLFQPGKHTSFNGVLLVRWSYNLRDLIDHEFHYVNNPYARKPIADLAALFHPCSD